MRMCVFTPSFSLWSRPLTATLGRGTVKSRETEKVLLLWGAPESGPLASEAAGSHRGKSLPRKRDLQGDQGNCITVVLRTTHPDFCRL